VSLVIVQWMETVRRAEEAGLRPLSVAVPAAAKECAECHEKANPGLVGRWRTSAHARRGVACLDCHRAEEVDADAYLHYGARIATVVSPRDCSRCHEAESAQFARSQHARGGDVLASVPAHLAATVEGAPADFIAFAATPGGGVQAVDGLAGVESGCQQCHGTKVAFLSSDGGRISVDELVPDEAGRPTNRDAVERIVTNDKGVPIFHPGSWPNTGIGRLNFDGSRGSCSACHSRHDFSPRLARRPGSCGRCHTGPDHSQHEVFEESMHGAAYHDVMDDLALDSKTWVLGEDYSLAPTCATCHLSGHLRNGGEVTHNPGERVSWSNRPPVSVMADTDVHHMIVEETDPDRRAELIHDSAEDKRYRMKEVCAHCHTLEWVNAFYYRYDNVVGLYNEKFARPGVAIMAALADNGVRSDVEFDERIEWTWFRLWHQEGRVARHGAAMMAAERTQWLGLYEVSERFYADLIPQALALADRAEERGSPAAAHATRVVIEEILSRPEHAWRRKPDSGDSR
jgi:hypothetical protein